MHFNSLITLITLIVSFLNVIKIAYTYKDPLVSPGRSVMIHLFEWKWTE